METEAYCSRRSALPSETCHAKERWGTEVLRHPCSPVASYKETEWQRPRHHNLGDASNSLVYWLTERVSTPDHSVVSSATEEPQAISCRLEKGNLLLGDEELGLMICLRPCLRFHVSPAANSPTIMASGHPSNSCGYQVPVLLFS